MDVIRHIYTKRLFRPSWSEKKKNESPVAEELVTPFIYQVDFLESELKLKNLIKNKLIEKIECSRSHFHLSTIKTGKKTP